MPVINTLKAAFIGSTLLLGAHALPSYANAPQYDEFGLPKAPVCGYDVTIKNALKTANAKDTGQKSSNADWEMTLYYSTTQSKWALLGKSKAPTASTLKSCWLSTGTGDYTTQKWYQEYFAKKPAPGNIATETVVTPKPKLN